MVKNKGFVSIIPPRGNLATEPVRLVIEYHLVKNMGKRKQKFTFARGLGGKLKDQAPKHVTITPPPCRSPSLFTAHSLRIHFTLASSLFDNAILRCVFCWIRTWSRCTHLSLPMESGVETFVLNSGPQVQRKVVVCGDGACGELCLHAATGTLPAQLQTSNRKDLATERFHERLLHPSIVRPHPPPCPLNFHVLTVLSNPLSQLLQ